MTKYLSMTKLISLLPEFSLTKLYDELKNDMTSNAFYENGMRVFEYPYPDSESKNNFIQYVYHVETKTFYIRYIAKQTEYRQREYLQMQPYTKWLVAVKSPEMDCSHLLDDRYHTTEKFTSYINLINYVLCELKAKTSTLKSIIEDASIELDDPNDIFNVPSLDFEWNNRGGDYLYLNGLNNGALFGRIPYIIDHIEDSKPKQLQLLNYTSSLVTRLSFTDLTELAKLLRKANRNIQIRNSYYITDAVKTHFNHHLTSIITKIQERRDELMATQVQTVPLSVWENDAKLRESIEQGANVRVVLPISLAKNEKGE